MSAPRLDFQMTLKRTVAIVLAALKAVGQPPTVLQAARTLGKAATSVAVIIAKLPVNHLVAVELKAAMTAVEAPLLVPAALLDG